METKSTERYESGISENNLKHWGILEAVKELLQNNVYAKTILGDNTGIVHDGKFAVISNNPSGFTKGKLLIGESEQADVAGAPGQYGEGMKVAMAVARRCGKECYVSTNGFIVRPELEPSSLDQNVRVLTYYIEDTNINGGTTFYIECDLDVLQNAMASFAVLAGIDEESIKTNTILDTIYDTEEEQELDLEGGLIYVNGVLVYQTPAIFTYNFTNPELMNRDRTSVDISKVKSHVVGILADLDDEAKIASVLRGITMDNEVLEAQCSPLTVCFKDLKVWKNVSKKVFGEKVAIATGGDSDTKARYHKFKVLTNVPSSWRYFFENALDIPYTDNLEEIAEKPKNVHKKPNADESSALGWAKMLIRKYYGDYGTVRVSEKVVDEYGTECYGLYDRRNDVIWIKRELLQSKELTFKTLLHESIHKITGATDNTAYFTQCWEDACWKILNRGKVE